MISKEFLLDPTKLLYKKPFTRGANEDYIKIFRQDVMDDTSLVAEIPSYTGKTISQSQYLLELDPSSHAIIYNDDLPKLSHNPNASWDEANAYRASFAFQSQIARQHGEYVNTKPMKFTLLNTNPSEGIHKTFIEIKDEWVTRNMNVKKSKFYDIQKTMGDAAMLFYFNNKGQCKTRLLSFKDGYQLIPQYDDNGEMTVFSVYYTSEKKKTLDVYDETRRYRFIQEEGGKLNGWSLVDYVNHGFENIPVVYKRGSVAWEDGQVLIDIYELLYNIYLIVEKKVGFPLLYIIGKPTLDRRSDTAAMLKDASSSDSKSDAKYLNPAEPKGFQELLSDVFKKIQIFTSSILVSTDEIKITSDISGVAMKTLRSSIYERAQGDIRDYDEVADKMMELFKEGVSKELIKYAEWSACKVRAEYELYVPQSETEFVNRLVSQTQNGIISIETATEISPDSQPDERQRLEREKIKKIEQEEAKANAEAERNKKVVEQVEPKVV